MNDKNNDNRCRATRMFQINEDDLAEMESNLSLIFTEGQDWTLFNNRPDLREAWEMTIKTLSNIRFIGGPPSRVEIYPVEEI
jgi:hypothetical protein